MTDFDNQLAIDLGEGNLNTEQQAEVQEAEVSQNEVTSTQNDQDVDVASEIQNQVNLDKEKARQSTLQGQIKKYQEKLDSGEMSIEELPKDKQYLKKHLKYEVLEQEDSELEVLLEKKLEAKLQKQKDEQEYKSKLDLIKGTSISKEDKQMLIDKFNYYKKKGFLDGEALTEAIEFIGIKPKNNYINSGASMPKSSGGVNNGAYKMSDLVKLPQAEYSKIMNRVEKGEIRIIED